MYAYMHDTHWHAAVVASAGSRGHRRRHRRWRGGGGGRRFGRDGGGEEKEEEEEKVKEEDEYGSKRNFRKFLFPALFFGPTSYISAYNSTRGYAFLSLR
jgi:hypothetical protein